MKTCCWLLMLVMMLLVTARVGAQETGAQKTGARDQIQAANDNAVQSLRQQVRGFRLNRDMTIGQLVDKIDGEHDLVKSLAKAQQIGGPRWLDSQTCQVRLEIGGKEVASTLRQIVKQRGEKSPVTLEFLEARLADLEKRRFTADGVSTSGEGATLVRPIREADGWAAVTDENRKAAVCAARADAASKVIENISTIPLGQGKTVKDALSVKPVREAVEGWLSKRPVTGLEFGPDMQVRLGLSAPADELFETFRSAAQAQKDVPVPADAAGWKGVREGFAAKVRRVMGNAPATMPVAQILAAVELPADAPGWVGDQIHAEGASKKQKTKLKAAREAERDALNHMRSQVQALKLGEGLTIGEAEKRDPRFAKAIERALRQAKTYKVEYQADEGAAVKVNLDLREVWEEIRALR